MNNDSLIDKIINEVDIVEFIGRDIDLVKRGSNYVGLCPFHEDSEPSYTVNREKKYSKCFACNTGGNVITYYQKRHNVSFKEALRVLAHEIGIELNQEVIEYKTGHKINAAISNYYTLVMNLEQTGKIAREYLSRRNFDADIISKFNLGYAPSNRENIIKYLSELNNGEFINELSFKFPSGIDFFKDRLIIPILDDLGRYVGFSGRTLINENIKYLNSKEDELFQKRYILYNLNNAKNYTTDELYIAEGFFDVISLSKMGINNSVALMGTSFTKEHIDLIRKYKYKSINFILDQDSAGQNATLKAANQLIKAGFINIKVINFENYKDVDELISNEDKIIVENILSQKRDYYQYRIDYLKQVYNLNDIDEKTKFIKESIEDLNKLSDEKVASLTSYLTTITAVEQNIIRSMIYKGVQSNSLPTNVQIKPKSTLNTPTDDDAVLKFAMVSKTNHSLVKQAIINESFSFKHYQYLFDTLDKYYESYNEYDVVNMLDFVKGNHEYLEQYEQINDKKYIDLNKVPILLNGTKSKVAIGLFSRKRR